MYIVSKVLNYNQSTIANIVYILNGDALAEQFPDSLEGEQIICREVLMDGPLSENLDLDFYEARAGYLAKNQEEKIWYHENVASQLERLKKIPAGSIVYLWFEYDLFCQVNYWLCLYWLQKYNSDLQLYWVRPHDKDWRGFGNYNRRQLEELFKSAVLLDKEAINWSILNLECYKAGTQKAITEYLKMDCLDENTKLILEAQMLRLPYAEGKIALEAIVNEIKEETLGDFAKAFRLFSRRHGHYGMGDLQFRSLFDAD